MTTRRGALESAPIFEEAFWPIFKKLYKSVHGGTESEEPRLQLERKREEVEVAERLCREQAGSEERTPRCETHMERVENVLKPCSPEGWR